MVHANLIVRLSMQVGGIQGVQEVMKYMSKEEGGTGGVIVILSSVLGTLNVFRFHHENVVLLLQERPTLSVLRPVKGAILVT